MEEPSSRGPKTWPWRAPCTRAMWGIDVIYLDNAATSFPKPPEVAEAILEFLAHKAGNPGRSGHSLALAADAVVAETRRSLASLLGVRDPSRLAFTLNATEALNLAMYGLLRPGDRVVTTSMEHNA